MSSKDMLYRLSETAAVSLIIHFGLNKVSLAWMIPDSYDFKLWKAFTDFTFYKLYCI